MPLQTTSNGMRNVDADENDILKEMQRKLGELQRELKIIKTVQIINFVIVITVTGYILTRRTRIWTAKAL